MTNLYCLQGELNPFIYSLILYYNINMPRDISIGYAISDVIP
jgi:hypothetical protein